jgi:hypothetical protein
LCEKLNLARKNLIEGAIDSEQILPPIFDSIIQILNDNKEDQKIFIDSVEQNLTDERILNIENEFSLLSQPIKEIEIDIDISFKNIYFTSINVLHPNFNLDSPNKNGNTNFYLVNYFYDNLVLEKPANNLTNLYNSKIFWSFSYLLFPPVQDGRISSCINEPAKMIAPPFMPESQRVINGERLRSTLLEAIIRIKLDIISGTNLNSPGYEVGRSPSTLGDSNISVSYIDVAETFGVLEALIIARLFASLEGMAKDITQRTLEMAKVQNDSGYVPKNSEITDPNNPGSDNSGGDKIKPELSQEEKTYRSIQQIEESLLLLLGDNATSEAIDLQEGVFRTNGLKDSHLISSVISIIDVPRRWVNLRINKISESYSRLGDKHGGTNQSKIKSKLGFSKGVGAIDVLAYFIALFTSTELTLLSLLTEDQFNNMKKEFPQNFFNGLERKPIDEAINDVASSAYEAYELFRILLKSSDGFPVDDVVEDDTVAITA